MNYHRIMGCLAALAVFGNGRLEADVKMSAIFGDHMVLQQDISLPVWGTADAGEKVTVKIGTASATSTAGADGKWLVKLAPLPVGTTPITMMVTGKNNLKFEDVLVGDVWVCSGQSNMEFGIGNLENGSEEIAKADVPLLRIFYVTKSTSLKPLDEIKDEPKNPIFGHWEVCTPETVAKAGGWGGFTAVGYFFGREIQKTTNKPIGLIGSSWGGVPAQSFTSLDALKKNPEFQTYVDAWTKLDAHFAEASAAFPALQEKYQADQAKWDREYGAAQKAAMADWSKATAQARQTSAPPLPKPHPPVPAPRQPTAPDGGPNVPASLFNGMISPLIPYGIKGAIWYQGEANAGSQVSYRDLFGAMIVDWRERWGEGNFPFLFVQLARYHDPSISWSLLRESQLQTLALPNTGMAVAFDIGDNYDVHPKDKLDVGLRLALVARHVAYGEDLVYSGPLYDKLTVTGNQAQLSFTQIGSGLMIGVAPWVTPGATPLPRTSLLGFTIAGADRKWVPADAKIVGETVVVSSPQVSQPAAVRYAWENAIGNLYNKEKLPASPFRTDDWMDAPPDPQPSPSAPKP